MIPQSIIAPPTRIRFDGLYCVGFTGTRQPLTLEQRALVDDCLVTLPFDCVVIWGGCVGLDFYVGYSAEGFGLDNHVVLPPDRRLIDSRWREVATTCEEVRDGPDGYRRRNQRIVDLSDRLIAFPLYPEDHPESRRSGTWQTCRMARRKGIMADADIHVLSAVSRDARRR